MTEEETIETIRRAAGSFRVERVNENLFVCFYFIDGPFSGPGGRVGMFYCDHDTREVVAGPFS
jgi:hypothetical protein